MNTEQLSALIDAGDELQSLVEAAMDGADAEIERWEEAKRVALAAHIHAFDDEALKCEQCVPTEKLFAELEARGYDRAPDPWPDEPDAP